MKRKVFKKNTIMTIIIVVLCFSCFFSATFIGGSGDVNFNGDENLDGNYESVGSGTGVASVTLRTHTNTAVISGYTKNGETQTNASASVGSALPIPGNITKDGATLIFLGWYKSDGVLVTQVQAGVNDFTAHWKAEVTSGAGLKSAESSYVREIYIMNNITLAENPSVTSVVIKGGTGQADSDNVVFQALAPVKIFGNNYIISAYVTGTNSAGICNASPSQYIMFYAGVSGALEISDLTLYGGGKQAVAVYNSMATMTNCTVSRCGSTSFAGGAVVISTNGKLKAKNCNFKRNVACYGGAMLITGPTTTSEGSIALLENCVINENRNVQAEGGWGGGAIEINNGSKLYFVNSTLSNNQSTEIGGGVNGGKTADLYIINSTVTGNVTSGGGKTNIAYGGGLGVNKGNIHVYNSIVTNNYHFNTDTNVVTQCDIGLFGGNDASLDAHNSIIGSVYRGEGGTSSSNVTAQYTGSGKTNQVGIPTSDFYRYDDIKLLHANGDIKATLPSPAKSPIITDDKIYLFADTSSALSGGAYIYFNGDDINNIKFGYGTDNSTITNVIGEPTINDKINLFKNGVERNQSNIVIGALYSIPSNERYAKITGQVSGQGTVDGYSIFSNYYLVGKDATFVAAAKAGFAFMGYYDVTSRSSGATGGGTYLSSNLSYTFPVKSDADLVLEARFVTEGEASVFFTTYGGIINGFEASVAGQVYKKAYQSSWQNAGRAPAPTYTDNGVFIQWYSDATFTTPATFTDSSIKNYYAKVTDVITYTFMDNESTAITGVTNTNSVTHVRNVDTIFSQPNLANYKFVKWTDSSGSTIVKLGQTVIGAQTVIGVFKQRTISFDGLTGANPTSIALLKINGQSQAVESASKAGFAFGGWSFTINTTSYTIASGSLQFTPQYANLMNENNIENLVLTAIWTDKLDVNFVVLTAQTYTYNTFQQGFVVNTNPHTGEVVFSVQYSIDSGAYTPTAPTNVGTYNVKISSVETANYKAYSTNIVNGLVISKAVLVKPTLNNMNYTYSGFEQSAILNDYDSATMTATNNKRTNAGTFSDITAIKVNLSDSTNYKWADDTITEISIPWTINKLQLTVSGTSIGAKVYDGKTTATASVGTVSGIVSTDSGVTVTITSATFNDANVASANSVTVVYTLSGDTNSNYIAPISESIKASISTAKVTIEGLALNAKTYGDIGSSNYTAFTQLGVATVNGENSETAIAGGFTFAFTANGGQLSTGNWLKAGTSYTATYTFTSTNPNYANASGTVPFAVNKADITATFSGYTGLVYNGATRTISATLNNAKAGDSVSANVTYNATVLNATSYTATATLEGADSANYNLTSATQAFAIAPKQISVVWTGENSAANDFSWIYSGLAIAPTASVDTGVLNQTYSLQVTGGEINVSASAYTAVASAGNGVDSIMQGNYTLINNTQAFNITQKTLTVSAVNCSIIYNSVAPTFGVTYSGFAGNESASNLNGALAFTCSYVVGNSVGNYTITPSGYTSNNYDIAYSNGALTVSKAVLVKPTLNNMNYTYNGFEQSVSLNGFDSATMTATNDKQKNAGTYSGTTAIKVNLIDTTNYKWTDDTIAEISIAWTINKLQLTVSGTSIGAKVYDGKTTATASVGTVSGIVSTDSGVTVTITSATFDYADVNLANAVTVVYALNGDTNSNYIAPISESIKASISTAKVTIEGLALNAKTYGDIGSSPYTTFTQLGVATVNGENSETAIAGGFTFAFTANGGQLSTGNWLKAGTSYTATYTFTSTNPNYANANGTVSFAVNKADVTATFSGHTALVYNGAKRTISATLNNVKANDIVSANVTCNATVLNATSYTATATLDGADSANYNLTGTTTQAFTIAPCPITVTIDDIMSGLTYDGSAKTTTAQYTGMYNGDTLSVVLAYQKDSDNAHINAGTWVVTISSATVNGTASNYIVNKDEQGTMVIDCAQLPIVAEIQSATYSGQRQEPTITVGKLAKGVDFTIGWGADTTLTNAKTYTATITGAGNYTGAIKREYRITKATVAELTAGSKVYNGSNLTSDIVGTRLVSVTANKGGVDVGEYDVVISLIDFANYKWELGLDTQTRTLKFAITKAENAIDNLHLENWVYRQSANVPTCDCNFGKPTFTYSAQQNSDYTSTVPSNIGVWFVKASIAETKNYKGAQATQTFSIVAYTYKISFDKGFEGAQDMPIQSRACNDGLALTKNIFVREGYVFVGWKIADSGIVLSDGATGNISDGLIVMINLVAQWKKNVFTYAFFNDDLTLIFAKTANYGESIEIPSSPTKEDSENCSYRFIGWDNSIPETLTCDLVFVAKFAVKTIFGDIDQNEYADENNCDIQVSLPDNDNRVLSMTIQDITEQKIVNNINNILKDTSAKEYGANKVLKIELSNEGNEIEFVGNFTVRLKEKAHADFDIKIMQLVNNEMVEINYVREGDYIVFDTISLGNIVVLEQNVDANLWALVASNMVLILLELGYLIFRKKPNKARKANKAKVTKTNAFAFAPIGLLSAINVIPMYLQILLAVQAVVVIVLAFVVTISICKSKKQKNDIGDEPIEEPILEQPQEVDEGKSGVGVIDIDGKKVAISLRKSFTAKLIQSNEEIQGYYSRLKNRLEGYSPIKSRMSWSNDSYNSGRNKLLKFAIRGKTLVMFVALSDEDIANKKFHVEYNIAKKYAEVPMMIRVKGPLKCKHASEMIDLLCAKFGLTFVEEKNDDYSQPYDTTESLIARKLIKVYADGDLNFADVVMAKFGQRGLHLIATASDTEEELAEEDVEEE